MQRKWRRNWQRAIVKVVVPPVAAGMIMIGACGPAWASGAELPTGGQVVAGSGAISQSGSTMTVTQTTGSMIANWQSFSIGVGGTVNFVQPSSTAVALNRVVGSNASNIYGTLTANGRVYLINPNGVLFAPGAQVNVGGLVASTLNMSDSDFLSGKYVFAKDGSAGSVVNQGTITAADHAVLIGPQVKNEGVIAARVVGMTAGDKVSLDFAGDKLLGVTVDTAAAGANVSNSGAILADGGLVVMSTGTKDALLNTVVNNTGIVRAQTVSTEGGVIKLIGSTVNVAGTLDASAPQGGNGGFIDTSGAKVKVAEDAKIITRAASGKNGKWLIDPDGFTIAATGGDMTPTTVQNALQNGNVEILSTNGNGADGNINVNDAVSWNTNKLTLTANRDIRINAAMTASGSASLTLNPATANGGGSAVAGGTVLTGFDADGSFKGKVNFSGSGTLIIGGNIYTVINSYADLATMAGNLGGYYALGSDLTASSLWTPVGYGTPFAGVLDGLGHTVSGLKISVPGGEYVGLFAFSTGTIRNLGLTNADIRGDRYVGGLAGENRGAITNSFVTGAVDGTGWTIGGLAGINYGTITNSYMKGAVVDSFLDVAFVQGILIPIGNSNAGGLVGVNTGSISGSYSMGAVGGLSGKTGGLVGDNSGAIANSNSTAEIYGGGGYAGGLAGQNSGTISGSYSTGKVTGLANAAGLASAVGGLVGINRGSITGSYSTGEVTGDSDVGGLVGASTGQSSLITGSYSTGKVTGASSVGGLVGGIGDTTISGSYSTGDVSSTGLAGGLVGFNYYGSISNSYSSGRVSGTDVGGLVGQNFGAIANSYSTGVVTGTGNVGGLVGENVTSKGVVTGSYWNKETSGTTVGIGAGTTTGATGLTSAQMKLPGIFQTAGWDMSTTGGSSAVWRIYEGYTSPLLRSFLTPLTVGVNVTKTYDRALVAAGSAGLTYSPAAVNTALINYDNLAYTGPGSASIHTGTYAMTASGLYSGQQGYDISYAAGTLTINKAALTISAANVTKTYDGTTGAAGSAVVTGGTQLYGTDTISGGSFAFADKNAGTGNKTVTVSGVTVNDGNGGNNYTVTYADNTTSTINKAALTVTASGQNKTYDGTTTAAVIYGDNRVTGDQLTVSGTASYQSDGAVGTNKTINVSGIGISGADAGNYTLTGTTATTTADITKAALTVTADNATKTPGQPNPTFTASYIGLAAGDTAASLTGGLTFTTAATTSSLVGSYAISLTGTLASPNYTVSYVNGVLTIRAATNPPYTGAVGGAFQLAGNGSLGSTRGGFGGGTGGFGGTTALGDLLTISGGGLNPGGQGQGGQGRNP